MPKLHLSLSSDLCTTQAIASHASCRRALRASLIWSVFTLSLLVACSQSPAPTQDGQGEAAEEGGETRAEKPWSVRQDAVTATVGAPGAARLQIQAAPGFKINAEFPSRVVASADVELLSLPQTEVLGTFEGKELLTFVVPFEGRSPGAHQIQLLGDFSVCLDDENGYCLLFRQEPLALNIQVDGSTSAPAAPAAQPAQR